MFAADYKVSTAFQQSLSFVGRVRDLRVLGQKVDQLAKRRERLSTVERQLAELQARYDLAMSRFKFDEASTVQRQISVREAERQSLAAALPAPVAPPEPPLGVVPVISRARRRRVRRRT